VFPLLRVLLGGFLRSLPRMGSAVGLWRYPERSSDQECLASNVHFGFQRPPRLLSVGKARLGSRVHGNPCRPGALQSSLASEVQRWKALPGRRGFSFEAGDMLHMHDIDAWRAALGMIQYYGPLALQRALAHIDNLRMAGDVIGVVAWARIADAVAELNRARRNDEPLN
jgi:hypothetical protein